MYVTLSLILLLGVAPIAFVNQSKFGKTPKGERLEKMQKSPNYTNKSFQNIHPTPTLTEDSNHFAMLTEFILNKNKTRRIPQNPIPATKTDLINLDPQQDVLVWFGHSSYFMQIDGKRILVDPVLSGNASPVSFTTKAFPGTDLYSTDDIPPIDYLFITHDHWDHLDYDTIMKLKPKIGKIICGLGVGAHFAYWGFPEDNIIERDWKEEAILDSGFTTYFVPARHFSGRGFKRNQSLWTSFVLQTPTMKLFLGGDGGYDTHFAEAGKTFGDFDLAILENGQYDKSWRYIHMMPEEVLQVAKDLHAKRIFPIHSAKFSISNHPWFEPLTRIAELCKKNNFPMLTPIIGQKVFLKDSEQQFSEWWKNIK